MLCIRHKTAIRITLHEGQGGWSALVTNVNNARVNCCYGTAYHGFENLPVSYSDLVDGGLQCSSDECQIRAGDVCKGTKVSKYLAIAVLYLKHGFMIVIGRKEWVAKRVWSVSAIGMLHIGIRNCGFEEGQLAQFHVGIIYV